MKDPFTKSFVNSRAICLFASAMFATTGALMSAQLPAGVPAAAKTPQQAHPLVWDAMEKTVTPEPNGTNAEFVFWVTNTSPTADVIITGVQPACGCTTPSLPPLPWKLVPGTNGQIKATMDVKGSVGMKIKTMTVNSTAGHQILTLKANISKDPVQAMAERQMNMERAKADHQAVFKGECAKCHVEPTVGKLGEPLFTAACAICHDPEQWAVSQGKPKEAHHRADVVPDLATLTHPLTRSLWKIIIANGMGKPGSLMPAFSKRHDHGPLTDEQIESLVEYTTKKFPFNPANATNSTPVEIKKSAQAEVKKSGFTTIQIMVAIAIAAILGTILSLAFNKRKAPR